MKLNNEEKDIIKRMIINELNYYQDIEDKSKDEKEYIKTLIKLLNKMEGE